MDDYQPPETDESGEYMLRPWSDLLAAMLVVVCAAAAALFLATTTRGAL